jgi:chromate transporter
MPQSGDAGETSAAGSVAEVFATFLKLGLTSFGGPIAHLGYFHREIVARRGWIDEAHYGQLLALCQFLPGPASSQLGFALGLMRAGWLGAIAAFIAFTLPSALLLFAFAYALPLLHSSYGEAVIHGLKLVAVAVVAQGLIAMAARLTPALPRRLIAAAAAAIVVFYGSAIVQLAVVAGGALAGLWLCRDAQAANGATFDVRYGVRTGAALVAIFALLLAASLGLGTHAPPLAAVGAAFYRAGALVFGGGHVVLPLLEETVVKPGWITADVFLAGYGAAQAVPGPMFTLAGFLGASLPGAIGGFVGAATGIVAIFAPGLLLVAGALPLWRAVGARARAVSAISGINAAVVGLLAAALYDPVIKSAVLAPTDVAIALVAFLLVAVTRASVLFAVAWCALASLARQWLTQSPA